MTRRLITISITAAIIASAAWAASPPRAMPLERTIDQLDLTDDQKPAVNAIVRDYQAKQQQAREEFLAKMKSALTPEQYAQLESSMNRPPPPVTRRERREATDEPTSRPATVQLADGSLRVPVVFTGGYETDPRDGGRPVVLVAAALGVPSEVFRSAFTGVTPAGPGEEPKPGQVRRNKQALLKVLGPYGITNDQLDTVSNQYRYAGSKGEMWRHTPAVATAHVVDGVVKEFSISDAGSGYSSPPLVSVVGMDDGKAEATLSFGTDFKTNGSIKSITVTGGK